MNLYDENLRMIQKYKPSLYDDIRKMEAEEQDEVFTSIEMIKTREGHDGLLIEVNKEKYRLNSSYYPLEEAKKWVDQYEFQNLGIVVSMFGFGNGIIVREILKHLDSDGKIIIYEPSKDILLYSLKEENLFDIWADSRVQLYVGDRKRVNLINEIGSSIHWTNIYSQIICKHPQYDKAFLKEYRDFLEIVNENNERTFINRNTESFFGKKIVENTVANLSCLRGSNTVLDYLGKLPADVPAIIVSAGPSLDKNIDELKRAKGKAVIVATDTALRYLFAHDIDPDFVVTLDPQKPAQYFDNPRCKSIPMFCKIESNREILCNHTGKKILFSCHNYVNQLYYKIGKIISGYNAGGSVATGAFSVCAGLKFNRIILIGQDLAYGNGVTHAGGDISPIRAEEDGIRMIEDIHGNRIKTRHDWYIYLQWFVHSIESVPEIEVIDATEGGARIKGTKLMTLKNVIDQFCIKNIDCDKIVKSVPPTLNEEETIQMEEMIADSRNELDKIVSKSIKAISLCNKVIKECKYNRFDSDACINLVEKITKINNYIEGTLVYELIDSYITEEASKKLATLYQFSKDQKEDRISTFTRAIVMYELTKKAALEIKQIFFMSTISN